MKEKLTRDIKQSLKEISSLYWVTRNINDTHDSEEIFAILVKILDDLCDYDSVILRMYNEDTGELILELAEKKRKSIIDEVPISEEVMGWALENRKIRIIPLESMNSVSAENSLVLIPLINMDRVIGFICIVIPASPGSFTPHLEKLFWIIAGQVASAMQNARFFKKLQDKNRDLKEVKKYLTGILDNMVHGIMVLDKNKNITLLSKSMEILFQVSSSEARNGNISKVFPKKTVEIFNIVMKDVEKFSFVIDREFDHILKGGKKIPISVTASSLELGQKQSGTIFVVKDLSTSKRLIALAELDKLKSKFVATVSHEFKTPLNLILGSTNLLLEGLVGPFNEKQSKLLTLVRDGGNRLMELIKRLLDLARIEAEKGHLSFDNVSLKDIVEDSVQSLQYMSQEYEVTIEHEFLGYVDDIVGDNEQLSYMLKNLVSNGIKYNNPGGYVKIVIENWEKDKTGKFVLIRVKDNGIGINAEDHEEIFAEFHRSNDPEAREREGSGLGLTIAKKVVELHRGKIILESQKGKGSEFKIILPTDPRIR